MKLEGKAKLLRIHFGEDDKRDGKSLYEVIVDKCHELGIAGVTVYRGLMGYGASTLIRRSHLLPFTHEAPILVQIVDNEEHIRELLPFLDQVVEEGLIAISDVEVVKYVHQDAASRS